MASWSNHFSIATYVHRDWLNCRRCHASFQRFAQQRLCPRTCWEKSALLSTLRPRNGLKFRSRAGNFALWVEKRKSYTKQEVWPTEDRSAESLLPGSSVATFWTQGQTFLDCSNIKRVQLQFPSSFILKIFKLTPSIWDPAFSICSMPWVKLLHMWFQQLHHMPALSSALLKFPTCT